MKISLVHQSKIKDYKNQVILLSKIEDLSTLSLVDNESEFVKSQFNLKKKIVYIHTIDTWKAFVLIDCAESENLILESIRRQGAEVTSQINQNKFETVALYSAYKCTDSVYALGEGVLLANYQFIKYFSDVEKRTNSLKEIVFDDSQITYSKTKELCAVTRATSKCRDLVNEPLSTLNATALATEMESIGEETGVTVEVLNKEQITELKMGGLLGVNQGSIDPPTFTVMTYKPNNAMNEKPIVLVGKGVVYDTGGLSLKPTANSMDLMKSDMGGAAAVGGTIYAAAAAKLPVYLIVLIPATDNRPSGNAYAPGDVLTMMNGKTVEVLNTDAEGRLILGDALSYAKRFDPELVIDVATLTGAAAMAVGTHAVVTMGTASDLTFDCLAEAGDKVCERTVRFPFFKEYGEALKSDIADMKNIGTREGGAISAGKFLENFVEGDWVHMDIAGPAFLHASDGYRTKGGSGVGVRLLYQFLKQRVQK